MIEAFTFDVLSLDIAQLQVHLAWSAFRGAWNRQRVGCQHLWLHLPKSINRAQHCIRGFLQAVAAASELCRNLRRFER